MNRFIKGENNPKAKLTVSRVRRIRKIYEAYKGIPDPLPNHGGRNCVISAKKLAKRFNLHPSTMKDLLARRSWKFV